jgi:serine/threonine protein kinase/tetratricopeptide (TPR) repeat protein
MSENGPSSKLWERTWEVFHQVIEFPRDERSEALSRLCGGDDALLTEVEELLASHEEGLPLIEEPMKIDPAELEETAVARRGLLQPGAKLAGRFEIVDLVGMGGMGEVYEARDEELGIRVAVKTLLPALSADPGALARFRKEVLLARQVTHRNVCRLFDLVQDDSITFLTMEFLEGETLAAKLKREGPMSLTETRAILDQMVAGLEAAHAAGVVHRDLKPSNIFLTAEDSGRRVVVTDFGLATTDAGESTAIAQLTGTGEILGTPAYMAPEQLEGREAGTATDVYALGLLLYEMVTGHQPFTGGTAFSIASRRLEGPAPSPRTHLPDLESRWETVILRCLERQSTDRFQNPAEILVTLDDLSVARPSRSPATSRRFPAKGLALAGVLLAILAAALWSWRFISSPPPAPAITSTEMKFEAPQLLIVDFDNETGEETLSGVLGTALARELVGSAFVSIVPRQRVVDTLGLMSRPPDTPIDAEVGQEIAQRDGRVAFVLGGRVQKLGSTYVLSADLIRPHDGEIIASLSEEAAGQDRVLAAVRSLAETVEEQVLAEAEIEVERPDLPPVSTPSLTALKLYSEADRLFVEEGVGGPDRNEAAERLLREAIAEDPDFASAHIHLAYALLRQDRPIDEILPAAERALELSDRATPTERAFIRASYNGFRAGQDGPAARFFLEEAAAQYRTLLELNPDHFWGSGNLVVTLEDLGRGHEATEVAVRTAEISHRNNAARQGMAAWWVVRYEGDAEKARQYMDRAIELAGEHLPPLSRSLDETLDLHSLWLSDDIDALVARLQGNIERTPTLTGYMKWAIPGMSIMHMLDLGMYRRAGEVNDLYGDWTPEAWDSIMAWRHQDFARLHQILPREAGEDPLTTSSRALDLANVGLPDEAEALLEILPSDLDPRAQGNAAMARATIDLLRGRPQQAISDFEEGLGLLLSYDYLATYLMGSIHLARAWEELGYPDRAARALEEASSKRGRLIRGARFYWMMVELERARVLRDLGRGEEAAQIEQRLWTLTSYADPDFAVLRELERRREPPPLG